MTPHLWETCERVRESDYSPLKAALEKLTIPDVWQMLGVEGRPKPSCKSPFRDERNASFSIYAKGRRWKDHTTGEGGDAADFCAKARGLSREDGARLLIELAGTRKGKGVFPPASRKLEPYDPLKDPEKARKREGWPPFEAPTQAEIGAIATLRAYRLRGLRLSLSEVCSFAPTIARDAYGPSPTRSGLTLRRDAWTARIGSSTAKRKKHGPCREVLEPGQLAFAKR